MPITVKEVVHAWFVTQTKTLFFGGHIKLVSRWTNCVENGDNVKNDDLANFVLQLY
jgi:hypothetical protein